jgi:hypothetical protein
MMPSTSPFETWSETSRSAQNSWSVGFSAGALPRRRRTGDLIACSRRCDNEPTWTVPSS